MYPTVAIVGRPNVGKSTLFNRLLGRRKAIVHDRPGVTRDRNYEIITWGDREMILVDTGGFEPDTDDDLFKSMRDQVHLAMEEADVLILVMDRQVGLTPADEQAAQILRSTQKPVLLVVNKVDTHLHEPDTSEFWKLGWPDLIPLSAEHARGISHLMEEVLARLPPPHPCEGRRTEPEPDLEAVSPSEIRIAILGRPNVGKSTLANRLIGENRHLVHDSPGTTMDAVDSTFTVGHRNFRIVDTAGIRRRSRVKDQLEVFAVSRAIRTIERCHVTLFMLDATRPPATQDSRLVRLVVERGRALIFIANRWDLVRDLPHRDSTVVDREIRDTFPHAAWAPILYTSALTAKGCHRVLPEVEQIFESFNQRIPTPILNRFLREIEATNPPPQRYHHPVRIHFVTQSRIRPPTFAFFTNTPEGIKTPYRRFLANQLRQSFGFRGTPIRVDIRRKRRLGEPS